MKIRIVKTASSALVVQLIEYKNNKRIILKHIGSTHNEAEMMKFAQKHSDWMTKTKKYQHSGENIAEVINKGGGYYGESLALDAQICVGAWMLSPGHRKHLLNPNFTRIGSGFNQNNIDGYHTVVFKR